ncbi:hypothetical protein COV13_04440 [Candidatus Woesearchaeota archaeon CG10_big_fil_rev_8_21_14_0_10_32_9]|nr:MAG: hypothetical protein COV13_04440 [Candidatus Woesearchaeota archaeon CG10_big_fil_rev_8_21_14_0_10_32_9]
MVTETSENEVKTTIEDVLNVFSKYIVLGPAEIDKFETVGKQAFKDKILPCVVGNAPISFTMPGFPSKSSNNVTEVLGYLPDGAEEASFNQFSKFIKDMKKVYAPGVKLNIVSDGYVFNDLVKIPDAHVKEYEDKCKQLVGSLPLNWHTMYDLVNSRMKKEKIIEYMIHEFGYSEEELTDKIMNDQDITILYNGMNIFMQQEKIWPDDMSKRQMIKSAKELAKSMIIRGEAYTKLIKANFPDSIRLSCHPSTNEGTKYSWRFVEDVTVSASPWHNVLCAYENGSRTFKKKIIAEQEGLELVMKEDRPYYFKEKDAAPIIFN